MTNIIIVVVTILLGLFFKVAKNTESIKIDEGEYLLRYSNFIKWFCMGLIIFATVGLTALLLKHPIKDDGDFIVVASMYIALLLFGTYFYIEFFTVKILISGIGIKGTSGWRSKREYRWDEIENITYSPTSMWFKVNSSNAAPLRIHAYISGIDTFQRFYIEKLPEEKWIGAHEKFGQDRRVNK